MDSIRSIVWIGAQRDVALLAADRPMLDIVWECDVEGARHLSLTDYDALILACDGPDHALDELAKLSKKRPLPPILVQLDSSEGPRIREILARGASDVVTRETGDSDSHSVALFERLKGLARPAATTAITEPAMAPRGAAKSSAPKRGASEIVGASPQITETLALVDHASRSRVTVLLTGETGTGKELLARAIHFKGPRARRRFVPVNCAAFPDTLLESELFGHKKGAFTGADRDRAGLFEAATGGTLFLDEIGETSAPFQAKLLRVLQEREVRVLGSSHARSVDARVIAASNRDLRPEATQANFRPDLYYRVAVFPIHVPPLRSRPLDILPLAEHFLALCSGRENQPGVQLSREAADLLQSYSWPGNVRELENEIQRALAITASNRRSAHTLTPADFSERLRGIIPPVQAIVAPGETLRETLGRVEALVIRHSLNANGGQRTATARKLGITREGLYKKMKRYGIT